MPLTLSNFTQEIDQNILQRGRQYFRSGQIVDLQEEDEGVWSAEVAGTEMYEVEIEQGDKGALSYSCTCPYDMGPVCKHVTAVLYAIEENFPEYAGEKARKPRKPRKTRGEKLREMLERRSREELMETLVELAERHREIANLLMARFAEGGADKKDYVRLFKDALNTGKGREGYIDYWGAGRSAKAAHAILDQAEEHIAQRRAEDAAPILQAAAETVIPAIHHADDSNGELGGCINRIFELLGEASRQLTGAERRAVFEYCLSEATNPAHVGWDWGWYPAEIAAEMISSPAERAEVFAMLDRMGGRREGTGGGDARSWSRIMDYDREHADLIKLSVIEKQDGAAAALAFIKERLHLHGFRRMIAGRYLREGNFAELKRLAEGWLKESAAQLPGLRHEYQHILLEVAIRAKNQPDILRLAKQVLLEYGEMEQYDRLKETVPAAEWPAFVQGLIREVQQQRGGGRLLADSYHHEGMWDALMAMVAERTD